jgi:hypothetical protein
VARLSVVQQERIATIQDFLRTVEHVKHLVAELDGSRAAPINAINHISANIERELSQLRQRALTADVGAVGDLAGALSVLAGRSIGIALKIRGLGEGVQGLELELGAALAKAQTVNPPPARPDPPASGSPPAD